MTLLAKGIDDNSASYVNEAVRYMNAGKRQAVLATASMETIMAELGL